MRTIGVAMVRDEADMIESTITHMATQVDLIIVADNNSVDETRPILERLAVDLPLVIIDDPEVGYMQSEKMTRLAHRAGQEFDAEWVVPFDADEIWYSSCGRLGDFLAALPPADIVKANLFDHVCTGYDDPNESDPVKRIGWRRQYHVPIPKVACRYDPRLVIGMGNHEAWHDRGQATVSDHRVAIRHFPYRSVDQLIRKIMNGAQAYAATDLPPTYGAHWRQWGQILDAHGPEAIADLFHTWYYRDEPDRPITIDDEIQRPLLFDPAPVRA